MRAFLMATTALLWTATAASDEGGFAFKGLPLGASLYEMGVQFPRARCQTSPNPLIGDQICTERPSTTGYPPLTYGGAPAEMFSFFVYGGRVLMIGVRFHPDRFDAIRESLVSAYGAPVSSEDSVVTNAMGAGFVNQTVKWKRGGDDLELRRYAGELGTGAVTLRSNAWMAEAKARRDSRTKDGAKDL